MFLYLDFLPYRDYFLTMPQFDAFRADESFLMQLFSMSSITTGVVAVGGLVLTLFPPTAPIGAATLISSSIVGAPGAAYGTGNSLSD